MSRGKFDDKKYFYLKITKLDNDDDDNDDDDNNDDDNDDGEDDDD